MNNNINNNDDKKTRTKLYYVIVIFVLPLLASWLLYQYHDYFYFKTSNHGALVKPLIHADYLTHDSGDKKWRIIYISNHNCHEKCKKMEFNLHQIQIALGKDQKRVLVSRMDEQQNNVKLLSADFAKQNLEFSVQNKIYLVDPINNVFMYYSDTVNPMHILKDIKKVLEVSQIG